MQNAMLYLPAAGMGLSLLAGALSFAVLGVMLAMAYE